MPERFAPLPNESNIFRLVTPGGGHLPAGCRLPIPGWLAPTAADRVEADARGRAPGLSCWQTAGATVDDVRKLTGRPHALAFEANSGVIRRRVAEIAAALDHPIRVDILHDPADRYAPKPGWDAHAIIEGLERAGGAPRGPDRALRAMLTACFDVLA